MKNIKNKKQLLEYLDILIDGNKTFKMPKFSEIVKNSKFFNSEYKNLILIMKKKNKSFLDEMRFDQIILTTYFSATKIIKKIKQVNRTLYKKINSINVQKPIFRKQKSIYRI
jgi:hypothetical protein